MSNTDYSRHIYPLTIVRDRYSGVYSGGVFTAWHCDAEYIPEGISADDIGCDECWRDIRNDREWKNQIGFGDTIEEAIADLFSKLNYIEINDELEDCWF